VVRAPLCVRTVIFLALVGSSCEGGLNPVRIRPTTGLDSSVLHDASVSGDAAVSRDSSIPVVCPDLLIGYATMSDQGGEPDGSAPPIPLLDGGVTGGAAGAIVVVDATDSNALAEFSMYASDKMPGPLTIEVSGMINIPLPPDGGSGDLQKIRVSANKTVIGANPTTDVPRSGFTGGGLTLTDVSNVIIRNLTVAGPNDDDAGDNVDAIHIEGSRQIWVDHCDLSSNGPGVDAGAAYDGLVDISDGSDFVTVSWTHYHDHGDTGLVGRSDSSDAAAEDIDKNHVTYDHDLFTDVRTGPRTRFGTIHVLNTYFDRVSNYAIAATDGAHVRIEGNVFYNVSPPGQTDADYGPVTTILDSPATAGYVDLVSNLTDATDGPNVITTQAVPFAVPYPYTADSAASAAYVVPHCVGPGHVTVPPAN
jgi:pectate lyase